MVSFPRYCFQFCCFLPRTSCLSFFFLFLKERESGMGFSAGRVVQQNGNDQSVRPIPFNVLLKGDSGVGKTGIFSQCTKNQFSETFQSTIGVDFATKTLTFGDSSYLFKINDTAGQDRFRIITSDPLYRIAKGIILVYSVTNRASFNHIHNWAAEVKEQSPLNIKIILVGNKIDLQDQREVLYDEGKQLANELGFQGFFETSAKQNENVEELFLEMANQTSFVNVKRARD